MFFNWLFRSKPPDTIEAQAGRADVHLSRGELPQAAVELEAVLRQRPDWVGALFNYGSTLLQMGNDAGAERALQRVIELDPRFLLAYRLLGSLLHRHGRIAEMLRICRSGRRFNPESLELESFELFLLNFDDQISADELFARHRAYGERLEASVPPRVAAPREAASGRLRIGYVSSDFAYHPVGLFMLPLLERHDRTAFDVYGYATSNRPDALTEKLAAAADAWRSVSALSDGQLAELIEQDRIDLLIDLAGHSGICRLGVFARQPAPVQAAWLGYLNTTGLTRIAYRITDRYSDPAGAADRLHTETLVRLPHSQWCYRPFFEVDCEPAPAFARRGHVTFGSFAQTAKLTPSTRRLWARILARLPDARLTIVGAAPGRAQESLRRDFAEAGVAAARLTLLPFMPVQDYYATFDDVDIALDPVPYSGGTTTCDALWMGVPVLTLAGSRAASRGAASILNTLGLAEWVAATPDEYVSRAVHLAGERATLAALRATLRSQMRASTLMDEVRFTRDLEQAYRQMLKRP